MKTVPRPINEFEKIIGYTFKDKSLLKTALTHSTYSNEMKVKHREIQCNERLEFLGDSVLSIITSEYLFSHYKSLPEGKLTPMRAEVVCERALAGFAEDISLGDFLRLGVGEEKTNGREKKSILSDAFEAIIAAIYLDAEDNGKEEAKRFILPHIKKAIEQTAKEGTFEDNKTLLQQLVQQSSDEHLEYIIVGESGPDHDKRFEAQAMLNSNIIGRGVGKTKREAEQNAAREALYLFGELK